MFKSLITKKDVEKNSVLSHEDIGRWAVWNKGTIIFVSDNKSKCDNLIKEIK